MKLQKITISNFKSLRGQEFELTSFGCLVGENNAGKSSVLQAIVFALNRPSQLPIGLFYDPEVPVEFVVQFTDVDERNLGRLAPEHRPKIAALVVDGTLTLIVRYKPSEKVEVTVRRLVPIDPRYQTEGISAALEGRRGAAIREALVQAYPEFAAALPEGLSTVGPAKAFMAEQVAQLPREVFVLAEGPLPSGISTSISNLLPEPIYIPAVKNLSDDLKTTQSTSFGRLLGLLLEDMTPDLEEVNRSLTSLNALLNRVLEDGQEVDRRHVKVQALETLVEALLGENFPRVKVELRIPPPELKTILNAAQIFIDDGSRDLVDNKGDGIKRSLTFALLQAYVHHLERQAAEQNQGVAARPLLFLFEEPELYLHPKSQRVLFSTLARISATHQVVVTTHSPIFFAPGVTAAFVRIAKEDAQPKPVGVLYPVDVSLAASAETFRLARFEHADAAFFSRRVVLFEGESDDAFCKHVSMLLNPAWDFEQKSIALVRVSGKGNFAKFRRFFSGFGIDVKIVADLDALFDGYQHLGASAAATAIRQGVLQKIDARIGALGTIAEPAARQIKDKVHQESWKERYLAAKASLRAIQASREVDDDALRLLDGLFTWEQEIARVKVCRDDAEAAQYLVPLLDALRSEGICVLSAGAIEDYYPQATPGSGPKPERALSACALVATREAAATLARPLGDGRDCELHEIFEQLFAD